MELLCPIAYGLMDGPATASDGHTYERIAIQKWFDQGHGTNPTTSTRPGNTMMMPCHAIRSMVAPWRQDREGPKQLMDAGGSLL